MEKDLADTGAAYLDHPIYKKLFRWHDVYANLTLRRRDLAGWGMHETLYRKLFKSVQPSLVVEVGVWKGASCAFFGKELKRQGHGGRVLAVDTWLGALEMWTRGPFDFGRDLVFENGYPSIYKTFLSNMVHAGVQEQVIPMPMTSVMAAEWLQKNEFTADIVHLDAAHDYTNVWADLLAWWPRVRPGGLLFGDDFTGYWSDVRKAVYDFARKDNLTVESDGHKWLLWKRAHEQR